MNSPALAQVAAYLQNGNSSTERVGPFRVGFTADTTSPWLNYAVPVPAADPTPAEVAALVAAFERRGLLPRLEYLPGTAPRVEPALRAAGFAEEGRPPVMACAPGEVRDVPRPDGIGYRLATEPAVLREMAVLQHEAYGEPAGPTEHDVDRLVRGVTGGSLAGIATDGSTVVGAGQATRPVAGVVELAAVAVAGGYRRRGVAAALCAYLTRTAHDGGATLVWLEAGGAAEQRVYERAGYTTIGEKLYLSRK
jgi:ribosomal protein S18 acetylase RimI-like enzyme